MADVSSDAVKAFDATVRELGARSLTIPDKRLVPQELREFNYKGKRPEDGVLTLIEFPDNKGRTARCLGYQSGKFWPASTLPLEGLSAKARNEWAAKKAAEVYKKLRDA